MKVVMEEGTTCCLVAFWLLWMLQPVPCVGIHCQGRMTADS